MMDKPLFMDDKRWYEFDFQKREYVLTEQAPPEAVESYEQYKKNKAIAQKEHINL